MARRVFFSFHYKRDIMRASQVRNSWIGKPDRYAAGFLEDSSAWEALKRQGETAIKRWIDNQLDRTTVTIVLIGAETSERQWVKYEIKKSIERVNGFLGIYIDKIEDPNTGTDIRGHNPLEDFEYDTERGDRQPLSSWYKTYDWVANYGRNNLGDWVQEAYEKAGKK